MVFKMNQSNMLCLVDVWTVDKTMLVILLANCVAVCGGFRTAYDDNPPNQTLWMISIGVLTTADGTCELWDGQTLCFFLFPYFLIAR